MRNDNIAAISTALGAAGVAVIRISGDNPLDIAEKMFVPSTKKAVRDFEPNRMYAGEILADGFSDYGMCVFFRAPASFTGENTVEFHTHGGTAITKGVLKKILSLGARLAENGEFTRRAFLNGKLSLASAEGLIDMINSESAGGVRAGYSLYREKLTREVENMQEVLTAALSQIDADMDFPEEGLEETSREKVCKAIEEVIDKTRSLISTFAAGSRVKNGVKVGIVGKPNTGKSSLLNALLHFERAIVSDVAGTTRDVVEGNADIKGVRFLFSDTAGIRESEDKIENMGVALSRRVLEESDVLLFVMDASDITEEDRKIKKLIKDKNVITVINKSDKNSVTDERADVYVSALTGENIDAVKDALYERAVGSETDLNGDYLCEERHYRALIRAEKSLEEAQAGVKTLPLDLVATDIKSGWDALGEISGKTASEDIIDDIFSRFCVGK